MSYFSLFKSAFFLLCLIAILHIVGITFYFYWTTWWFDVVMHFLGGIFVSLVALWWYLDFVAPQRERLSYQAFLALSMVVALSVGILWELFELVTGLTFTGGAYYTDTFIDLVMDVFGGVVTSFIVYRYYKKTKERIE